MLEQVKSLTRGLPEGTFVDATLGGGNHADGVLESNPKLNLLGIDRDADAIQAAELKLAKYGDRVKIIKANFDQITSLVKENQNISGFLFDLGVSSYQLDQADRGFSYRFDGPLDMRMDKDQEFSAFQIVNDFEFNELNQLIRKNSDEKFSAKIAKAIINARPIQSTKELSQVVIAAVPAFAKRTGGNPAKRTFQAIRIEVNGELNILKPTIEAALNSLCVGGRCLVMTYHSGEDSLVKSCFRDVTESNDLPGLPIQVHFPDFKWVKPKVIRPTDEELQENPRSKSARMRVVERVGVEKGS